MPKRTFFPSMLPPGWVAETCVSMPALVRSGVPACSETTTIGRNMITIAVITPYNTQACRRLPIISPKQSTMELGRMIITVFGWGL